MDMFVQAKQANFVLKSLSAHAQISSVLPIFSLFKKGLVSTASIAINMIVTLMLMMIGLKNRFKLSIPMILCLRVPLKYSFEVMLDNYIDWP